MKRYIKAFTDTRCYSLFKVKASDQPIDMEDYDDYYYVLKMYYYRNAPYAYELVCEDDWKDPEVAAFAEKFPDRFIQLGILEEELALELWNKELKARGVKPITYNDLRQAVSRCWF